MCQGVSCCCLSSKVPGGKVGHAVAQSARVKLCENSVSACLHAQKTVQGHPVS